MRAWPERFSAAASRTGFAVAGLIEKGRLSDVLAALTNVGQTLVRGLYYKGSKQTAVSDPYRTSMNKFLAVFTKSNSAGAKPEEVAKVIYRAANDPGNRLRYLAKPGPFFWMNRILPDAVWRRLLMKAMVQ